MTLLEEVEQGNMIEELSNVLGADVVLDNLIKYEGLGAWESFSTQLADFWNVDGVEDLSTVCVLQEWGKWLGLAELNQAVDYIGRMYDLDVE